MRNKSRLSQLSIFAIEKRILLRDWDKALYYVFRKLINAVHMHTYNQMGMEALEGLRLSRTSHSAVGVRVDNVSK